MYFHCECGHIVEEEPNSSMISEYDTGRYDLMHLSACPYCGLQSPRMNYLDDSVCDEAQEVIYRLHMEGIDSIYVPEYQNPVESIRLESTKADSIDKSLEHEAVENVDQWENDVLIALNL